MASDKDKRKKKSKFGLIAALQKKGGPAGKSPGEANARNKRKGFFKARD